MSTGRMTLRADDATFERIDTYALEKHLTRGRSEVVRKALEFFFEYGAGAGDLTEYAMTALAGALYMEEDCVTDDDYEYVDEICKRALRAYRNNPLAVAKTAVEKYAREYLEK